MNSDSRSRLLVWSKWSNSSSIGGIIEHLFASVTESDDFT